jgi:predicted MFS family arabinose efflux permease
VSRLLFPFASMAFAFYTVYAVRKLGISIADAGVMTSILFITQVIANPLVGWTADRWNRKNILAVGAVSLVLSSILATLARDVSLFSIVMVLTGLGVTAFWTIGMAITLEFGEEVEKPLYIGLANTLIAPATIISPVIGGWLADRTGYETTFLVAAVAGVITFLVLQFLVREPVINH